MFLMTKLTANIGWSAEFRFGKSYQKSTDTALIQNKLAHKMCWKKMQNTHRTEWTSILFDICFWFCKCFLELKHTSLKIKKISTQGWHSFSISIYYDEVLKYPIFTLTSTYFPLNKQLLLWKKYSFTLKSDC